MARLARAGRVIARHEGIIPPAQLAEAPLPVRLAIRIGGLGARPRQTTAELPPLSAALAELGPSWIKLGQFLATRPDIVGMKRALELSHLQDRLPPFPTEVARAEVERELGRPLDELFSEFGEPVAAASIAQVHRARTRDGRDVAVKVLRPGVERRFARDLADFMFAARLIERFHPPARRLKPVEVVRTLERSVRNEMDLRMEAAALAEMAENTKDDPGFRLPKVDWTRTSRRVLTTEWIDGTPLSDLQELRRQGHDLEQLADVVVQSFLRQTLRDGFFHADMHQGNLFVDAGGNLVAVDLGITGRLSPFERRVWAEILYCFITRDYHRNAEVHFEAGYVPPHHSLEEFAQALRAIGEPVLGRPAEEVSMGQLLGQLFRTTEKFDMQTQPQLLMMQKTMVVVEGVARTLNPRLDLWRTAEPVVREWIEKNLGPAGRMGEAARGAADMGRSLARLPRLLEGAAEASRALADMARAQERAASRNDAWKQSLPLWLAAGALIALALGFWLR
jgi:ubiquinone biosynthesis protein